MTGSALATGCALVTGAARGIGQAIAAELAGRGRFVIVADVDLAAARACARDLTGQGWSAVAVELDVTDVDMVRHVVADVDHHHQLDTVVSNAGIAVRGSLLAVEPADYDRVMAVNVRGVFFVMQAALRVMVPRGSGSVVNICSTSAFAASTGPMVSYDASKAAVRMMTQAAAREVAASGVRVNAVAPGTVATDLVRAFASEEELGAMARDLVPMGRLGRPDEIGAAVAYLCGPDASYVTGHVLVADGGWLA